MHPSIKLFLLLAVVAAGISSTTPSGSNRNGTADGRCVPQERNALLAFKRGIVDDPQGILSSWRRRRGGEQDCCRWGGVICDNTTGHVLELHLGSYFTDLDGEATYMVGEISPSLFSLQHLERLDLSGNNLTGTVPSEVGTLGSLTYLNLGGNSLHGVITHEHFAGLTRLEEIDLSGNSFRIVLDPEWVPPFSLQYAYFAGCSMGPSFPHWLKGQVNMVDLDMSGAGVAGALPEWLASTFSQAWRLTMSYNKINGTLPESLEGMTQLRRLHFNSNKLTGQIPKLPIGLSMLDLSRNSLSGLPSNFGATYISELYLYSNSIAGPIPQSFCEVHDFWILDLHDNLLEGEFPPCFEPSYQMVALLLSNNRLSGNFPSFLQRLTNLIVLDLEMNKFSGRLPMWVGKLGNLEILRLGHNMFTESIPAVITNLTKLSYLDLANNGVSGFLPKHFSNLTGMTRRRQTTSFESLLNVTVITKGQARYYKDDEIYDLVILDFSMNYLTGEIPEDICSLDAVMNLNLSWNYFSGRIPDKIGAMQSLESLDLSRNMLYGEIPQNLTNITYLSYLDLSYNNLSGRIPMGGQLDTLYMGNPSMYNGNIDLCGPPLEKNCSDHSATKHVDVAQGKSGTNSAPVFFYFGLGLGFVAGLWVVFFAILFKKAWRIACFRLSDKVYDKLFVFFVVAWRRFAKKGSIN